MGVPVSEPSTAAATVRPTIVPIPGHEVYGFVPYWEMDDSIVDHVGATDLTTLALFSVTHRRDGELDDSQNGYRRISGDVGRRMARAAHDRGARVELVYTSFGPDKNRQFYTEPEAQTRWIEVLVQLVDELGLDGINVDVESLPAEHLLDYGAFVGRLRDALRARLPDAQVSVATQANELGAGMAAAAASAGADRIFLMGYDYHWAGSNPGASAPIDRLDGEPRDLVWSLDLYGALGVPVERTILGLPLYGMTWPVIGPGVGSPAAGRGDNWVPRWNLSTFADPSFEPMLEPVQSVEFYSRADPGGVVGDAGAWPFPGRQALVERWSVGQPARHRAGARLERGVLRLAAESHAEAAPRRRTWSGRRRLLGHRLRARPARLHRAHRHVPRRRSPGAVTARTRRIRVPVPA